MKQTILKALYPLGLLAILPGNAHAEAAINGADTAWIMASTALVLFMTLPGLAMFYAGLVRSRNVLSVLMQCFAIAGVASILWLMVGYSLAFGEGNSWIGDFSRVMLSGVERDTASGTIPESLFMMFQMTFAIITPALIVGGFAERMKFSAMLLFSAVWLLLVYVPVTHWVWGGGWLAEMGLYDFAGGTVVHITAGVAALVAAIVMGPRRGFPGTAMMPHNMTMTIAGAGMLWVGWFGFNGGSVLKLGDIASANSVAMVFLNTHAASAGGALAALIVARLLFCKADLIMFLNGALAGLVAITAEPSTPTAIEATLFGAAGGVLVVLSIVALDKMRIDDPVGAISVHGTCGLLGLLLVPLTNDGVSFSGQLIGAATIFGWVFVVSLVVWSILKMIMGIRVSAEEEYEGVDLSECGLEAYPEFTNK